jgi:hypothetical protein
MATEATCLREWDSDHLYRTRESLLVNGLFSSLWAQLASGTARLQSILPAANFLISQAPLPGAQFAD